jgi:hypothetical protein
VEIFLPKHLAFVFEFQKKKGICRGGIMQGRYKTKLEEQV